MMKINLSRRFFAFLIASLLLCTMASCGSEKTDSPIESEKVNHDEPVAEPTESYDDICELFKDVCSESEVIVLKQQNRLHVRIITKLQPNEKPDGWGDTLVRFGSALSEADNSAASYGASAVSAQIESSDETGVGSSSREKDSTSSLEGRTGGFISGNGSPQNPHTVFPLGTIASQ